MIKLKNVNKIYSVNKQENVHALKDININFPEKGMVFIVGKSGSGKSTLLNMIGSLDDLTSGEIIVDGNSLVKSDEKLLNDYRNSYLGFVFQDYYLIDQLTVYENIALALKINDDSNLTKVDEIISKVGLDSQKHRLPKSLSGGQKQRVAIARSVVKSPKVLLCDEPTGNLDSNTSKQIMTLLKNISKEVLVIIVSHNLDDAYQYADRIIEISDGSIVNDIINSSSGQKYEIKDNVLYVNNINELDQESLDKISKQLNENKIKEIQSKDKLFIKNNDENIKDIKCEIPKKKFAFKDKLALSYKLNRKRIFSTIFVSLLAAVVTVLLGLSQSFVSFSGDKIAYDVLTNNNQKSLAFRKGKFVDNKKEEVDISNLIELTNEDEKVIKDSNYQGNYYSLYNYSLPISLRSWQLQSEHAVNDSNNLKDLYAQEIYGVLPCDENYVKQVFGNDVTYHGNTLDKDYGIIITDYVADSIMFYRKDLFKNYDDILGTYFNNNNSVYGYINAIINTNYKVKHADLFKMYRNDFTVDELEEFMLTNEYLSFYEDVKTNLGIAYTYNENFINESLIKEARNICMFNNSIIDFAFLNEKISVSSGWAYAKDTVVNDADLKGREICFSLAEFNRLLNKNLTIEQAKLLEGNEITINRYRLEKQSDAPLAQIKCNLKIRDQGMYPCMVSDEIFSELRKYDVLPYMYYFDDFSNIASLYNSLKEIGFVPYSSFVEAGSAIDKVVHVFKNFFALILTLLLLVLVFVLGYSTFIMVKNSKHNIGILKALGVEDKDISLMFIFQILTIGIITSVLFIAGLFGFAALTNNILFDSFMVYLKNPALRFIEILTLKPWIFIADIAIIFGVVSLTMMIPTIVMKKIKPLNIIKKGD